MGQVRLNHLMILHVHRDITRNLNMINVANEFVGDSEHRLKLFGTFNWFKHFCFKKYNLFRYR